MMLFSESATFDPTRLADYGAMGLMLLMVVYAYNRSEKKLQQVYEDVVKDTRASLVAERQARQDFETRISSILDNLVRTVSALAEQVGQKRESIDQLANVVGDLVGIVQDIKSRPHNQHRKDNA